MVVPGRGSLAATYMIVGEAPGENEEREGKPFVGASGELVDEQLYRLGIEDDVWITNVVKVRPENNRTPTDEEIQEWLPVLDEELEEIGPAYVLGLGNVALKALTGMTGITKHRGIWTPDNYIFTFHPAYLLYNGRRKDLFQLWEEDWDRFYRGC